MTDDTIASVRAGIVAMNIDGLVDAQSVGPMVDRPCGGDRRLLRHSCRRSPRGGRTADEGEARRGGGVRGCVQAFHEAPATAGTRRIIEYRRWAAAFRIVWAWRSDTPKAATGSDADRAFAAIVVAERSEMLI